MLQEKFEGLRPLQTIDAMKRAEKEGLDITTYLDDKVMLLKLESSRSRLASISSGLKAWHHFAVDVLGYVLDKSLPPRKETGVVGFITMFKCAGMATNYVGYMSWACRFLDLPLELRGATIPMLLNGGYTEGH